MRMRRSEIKARTHAHAGAACFAWCTHSSTMSCCGAPRCTGGSGWWCLPRVWVASKHVDRQSELPPASSHLHAVPLEHVLLVLWPPQRGVGLDDLGAPGGVLPHKGGGARRRRAGGTAAGAGAGGRGRGRPFLLLLGPTRPASWQHCKGMWRRGVGVSMRRGPRRGRPPAAASRWRKHGVAHHGHTASRYDLQHRVQHRPYLWLSAQRI